jgi:hypothetical protein
MATSCADEYSAARRGLIRILAGTCLISLLLLSPVLAQAGVLSGTVAGVDGRPKPFAHIQLQGGARFAAVSDVTGKFTINNFTVGTYQVTIRQGDSTETQSVEIKSLSLALVVHW